MEQRPRALQISQHLGMAQVQELMAGGIEGTGDDARTGRIDTPALPVGPALGQPQSEDEATCGRKQPAERPQVVQPQRPHLLDRDKAPGLDRRAQRVMKTPGAGPDRRRIDMAGLRVRDQLRQLPRGIDIAVAPRIDTKAVSPRHRIRTGQRRRLGIQNIHAGVAQGAPDMLGKATAGSGDPGIAVQRKLRAVKIQRRGRVRIGDARPPKGRFRQIQIGMAHTRRYHITHIIKKAPPGGITAGAGQGGPGRARARFAPEPGETQFGRPSSASISARICWRRMSMGTIRPSRRKCQ